MLNISYLLMHWAPINEYPGLQAVQYFILVLSVATPNAHHPQYGVIKEHAV